MCEYWFLVLRDVVFLLFNKNFMIFVEIRCMGN